MLDIKTMKSALEQLEAERGIPKEKILEATEAALAAAYKKDYGKKGQIVRAKLDMNTGTIEFSQIKIVVDETIVYIPEEGDEEEDTRGEPAPLPAATESAEGEDLRIRFNPEHHIMLSDARLFKKDAQLGEELVFPLETKESYGRIAAQTARQVIIQKIREAEKASVLSEFAERGEEIVTGTVQRIERGNIFVDLGRATGILAYEDQIPGERYRPGERIRTYLYSVEESPRGVSLRLSRSHPNFVRALFALESPEVQNGVVEIKEIAREAGSRTKIAVHSTDEHVDPVGSCVGQRGVRVSTVISELGGEKIDVIEWSEDPKKFITDALSPAKVRSVMVNPEERYAKVEVMPDQLSLAIGRGGQNVRLAVKLTGYKIDIHSTEGGEFYSDEDLAGQSESPEDEMKEFIESESLGEPGSEVTPEEEAEEDRGVVEENINAENV
jgi:N utilization substance protein A